MYRLEKRHSHVHLHTPLKPHSHHHGKKEKTKKGPKKKKKDDTAKQSPEKHKATSIEEDGTPAVPGIKEMSEEKLERNIVDQTISVLPDIGEDEILATPPKQGWLSELADASTTPISMESPIAVVDIPKESEAGRHLYKHHDEGEKKDTPSSKPGRRHKHHHRHRHKSELQERRRPGVATIKADDKASLPEAPADATALDQKDVEDMKCMLSDKCSVLSFVLRLDVIFDASVSVHSGWDMQACTYMSVSKCQTRYFLNTELYDNCNLMVD